MASGFDDAFEVLQQWRAANPDGEWKYARDADQRLGQPGAPAQPSQSGIEDGSRGNWGLWVTGADRFARQPGTHPAGQEIPLRRFSTQAAATAYLENLRSQNPNTRSDIEVREIEPGAPIPGSTLDLQRQRAAQAGQFQEPSAGRGDLTPRGPGPWEIYRISDGSSVRPLDHTNRQAAGEEARSALGLRGEAPELYGVRTRPTQNSLPGGPNYTIVNDPRDAQQGGTVDVAGEPSTGRNQVGQTYTPAGSGEFTGQWLVLNPNNQVIYRFGGIGNSQSDANRVAIQWLQQNPRHMRAGVEVVPEIA